MSELTLSPELSGAMCDIYQRMASRYDEIAVQIPLTCEGCPDNCCDSYFQHHTYCEWAYLWEGLRQLEQQVVQGILNRAEAYLEESSNLLNKGIRPQLNCPLLLANGLCGLYKHRLMICRTHGIPAILTRPDGRRLRFPGCFRCQEVVQNKYKDDTEAPAMDRTKLFQQFVQLESRFLGNIRHLYPRLKMTIADMIVQGPPQKINSCLNQTE